MVRERRDLFDRTSNVEAYLDAKRRALYLFAQPHA
jgi:hypothetical protein